MCGGGCSVGGHVVVVVAVAVLVVVVVVVVFATVGCVL